MLTSNKVIMNAVDVSTSVNGPAYWLKLVYGFAIQAEFSGAPVGTVSLQGSCDAGDNTPEDPETGSGVVNWTTIKDSPQSVSGAGPVLWNYNGVFYKWVRLVYTATSGTGTVTVTMNTKGE